MNKILLSCLLFSNTALACTVPMMGPEFDKLIKVEKIEGNQFEATVKKEAAGLKYGISASIQYYAANSKHKMGEYTKKVFPREKGVNYVFTFDLKKIEGFIPYLHVFWNPKECCLCGAVGISKDLAVE